MGASVRDRRCGRAQRLDWCDSTWVDIKTCRFVVMVGDVREIGGVSAGVGENQRAVRG
ncbi:hypothetical protein KCP73_25685 [Salmonella enterica subsp. enterica]|nr:hypothetical protein KCP73_25685 [Salmonella enterica subsp. enterica]